MNSLQFLQSRSISSQQAQSKRGTFLRYKQRQAGFCVRQTQPQIQNSVLQQYKRNCLQKRPIQLWATKNPKTDKSDDDSGKSSGNTDEDEEVEEDPENEEEEDSDEEEKDPVLEGFPVKAEVPEQLLPLYDALLQARASYEVVKKKLVGKEKEASKAVEVELNKKDTMNRQQALVEKAQAGIAVEQKTISDLESNLSQLNYSISVIQKAAKEVNMSDSPDDIELAQDYDGSPDAPLIIDVDSLDEQADVDPNREQKKAVLRKGKADVRLAVASIEDEVKDTQTQMTESTQRMSALQSRLLFLQAALIDAESDLQQTEAIVQDVMKDCEDTMKDQIEQGTIVKETLAAYNKAMMQLKVLESESDSESIVAVARGGAGKVKVEVVVDKAEGEAAEDGDAYNKELPAQSQAQPQIATSTIDLSEEKSRVKTLAKDKLPIEVRKALETPKRVPLMDQVQEQLPKIAPIVLAAAVFAYIIYQSNVPVLVGRAFDALTNQLGAGWDAIARNLSIDSHIAEAGLVESIWLLLGSVLVVPVVCKIPGGNAVLGFLVAGAMLGPNALNVIQDLAQVRHLAELGVVFLLFNIGLELSWNRLQQLSKYVFGLGSLQFLFSLFAIAGVSVGLGFAGPQSIVIGGGLALSSTAVGMQVMQERNESGSKYGRSTFSVLLFQDLAVVALLILIPLLGGTDAGKLGLTKIAAALTSAGIRAVVCVAIMIALGKMVLAPVYRFISSFKNSDIFSALTLLIVLASAITTQVFGLSQALGAFLAGVLIAETDYVIQVESDIEPYKGLLMGLFFMTVGMEISIGTLVQQWQRVAITTITLITGKTAIVAALGRVFGLTRLQAIRSGLLLGPGGEFAFVAFGEGVAKGILDPQLTSTVYPAVVLSMALTPYLAALGARLQGLLDDTSMKDLQPDTAETKELKNHVIIAGFGRVGQMVAMLLSERFIPFVALDINTNRVQWGKKNDLPIYFGDAGSPAVLRSIGAGRAKCAVIALNKDSANYRCVYSLAKTFPHVDIFVRAHDIPTSVNLQKVGAKVVIPETLEPSLQLSAMLLTKMGIPKSEVRECIENFRRSHLEDIDQHNLGFNNPLGSYDEADQAADDSQVQAAVEGEEEDIKMIQAPA